MREENKKVLREIKEKLGQVFIDINKKSEDSAMLLVECIQQLEDLTRIIVEEKSSGEGSDEFANTHKPLCMKVGGMFDKVGLQYFIHIADPDSRNSISFGHMDDDIMAKSIGGAMIMSDLIFKNVLKDIGMPQNCIDCLPSPKDHEMRRLYRSGVEARVLGNMPEELKRKLEVKLEEVMRSLGPGPHTNTDITDAIEEKMGGTAIPLKDLIKSDDN